MAKQIRDIDEINARLKELSLQIYPEGLRLLYADTETIREQDVNAQSMSKKMFDQLIENVKNEGTLESTPLCVRGEGDVIYIISGHHRVRAARAAGVTHILILCYDKLPKSKVKAKQLAHNSIAGKSDPELVKRIFDEIDDIQAKFEAFIDPRIFDSIPKPVSFTQIDVDISKQAKTLLIVFLPLQAQDFQNAVADIMPKSDVDECYLANRDIFEGWIAALNRVRDEMKVVNVPTAIAEMARLAVEALDARKQAEQKQ